MELFLRNVGFTWAEWESAVLLSLQSIVMTNGDVRMPGVVSSLSSLNIKATSHLYCFEKKGLQQFLQIFRESTDFPPGFLRGN